MKPWAWLLLGPVFACYSPPRTLTLRVELPSELATRGAELRVFPAIAETNRQLGPGALALGLKRAAGKVTLTLSGACPLELDTRKLPDVADAILEPLFRLGPDQRVVGLGQRFTISAEPACREAEPLVTSFEIRGGAPLERIEFGETGRSFVAVTDGTPPLSDRAGIVAVSAREQQRHRSLIAFRVQLPDGTTREQTLSISAVARSSGLPNVGLMHPVLLSGGGWQLLEKPIESAAALRSGAGFSELVPDAPGTYRLGDGSRQELLLRSGRYDQTPLDCGRTDCHADIARSTRESPMTRVLESDLGGCHELGDPVCALGCHTTGEPGTADGGFSHVMRELALGALPEDYDALPRALKRLGGVGCLACHGPTKLPDPEERVRLLSNDVCAVCHDSPPRYGHVQALEASRMGHADSLPATRAEPCASCHTSWGALGYAAPRNPSADGISCVACHDVHPRSSRPQAAGQAPHGLLRPRSLPAGLGELPSSFAGISQVCISCHAPRAGAELPEASAAAIVAGRGGRDPTSDRALELPGPHAQAERGCLSCHDSGPGELVLGKTHGFVASEAACSRCHAATPARDPSLHTRARQLLERLAPALSARASNTIWHEALRALPSSSTLARSLYSVLLVLEDPAADVHNPAYAKLLLDAAEAKASR